MPKTNPWHSARQWVYHNNTDCADGREVSLDSRVPGTGSKRLCPECQALQRSKQVTPRGLVAPPTPEEPESPPQRPGPPAPPRKRPSRPTSKTDELKRLRTTVSLGPIEPRPPPILQSVAELREALQSTSATAEGLGAPASMIEQLVAALDALETAPTPELSLQRAVGQASVLLQRCRDWIEAHRASGPG